MSRPPPPVSARAAETFVPPGYDAVEPALRPRFTLKPPSLMERTRVYAAMITEGFFYPSDAELRAELRAMVQGLPEDTRVYWLGCLDEVEAAIAAPGFEGLEDDLAQGMAELSERARRHHPPFAALAAARISYMQAFPLLLFRRFCQGWEGYAVPCARAVDPLHQAMMVTEAAIEDLIAAEARAMDDITAAGQRLGELLRPGGADTKKSAPPSPSSSAPATSPAATGPATAESGASPESPSMPA